MGVKLIIAVVALLSAASFCEAAESEPRLIVLTDIGGDPDDQQSLIRLLHYANEFEIEGLIASAAGTPGELKEKVTNPRLIREIIHAYAKVRPNLAKHAPGYPEAESLLRAVKAGNARRGRAEIGAGKDSEGSNWIIAAFDRADARPVNIAVWGGQTDLAQALWRIREDRGPEGIKAFAAKVRIFDIDDQDGIAAWIWKEFPGLFYILSKAPKGVDKREGTYRGMYLGGDDSLVSREWMERNIRQGHEALGALYPPKTWTAPNVHSAIKEGDTPSWFYFLENGLNHPGRPDWGGWGGRYTNAFDQVYRDGRDTVNGTTEARASVWRWRAAFQHDFAARLDWAGTAKFEEANHAPTVAINGQPGNAIIRITAKAGETVMLRAEATDPDQDTLQVNWQVYPEAGTYRDKLNVRENARPETSLRAPAVTRPETVHVVCEVMDDGTPALRATRRIVVEVEP
jgi:hypothetical protein